MKPVLVLIDLQRDFLSDITDPHPEMLVYRVEQALAFFRSRSLPIVHLRMEVTLDPDNRMPHWRKENRQDCLRGTAGAQPPTLCDALKEEPVIVKPFFSGFGNPALADHLKQLEASCLILAGLNSHVCVKETALDAYSRGYDVKLLEGAVGTYDPISGELAERYLNERGLPSMTFQELTEALDGETSSRVSSDEVLPSALVCGQFVKSSESLWTHHGPADKVPLWSCSAAAEKTLDDAVFTAALAQRAWWSGGARQRKEVLHRFCDLLEANADRLAELLIEDVGKPWSHARTEIKASTAMVEAVLQRFEEDLDTRDERWRRRPLGVVALVTPFNNPLMIALGKIAPALAFGNSVVWKPALPGWRVACEAVKLLTEAGLPGGVLNLLCGGADIARRLMEHGGIDAVTISGGAKAGYSARAICAARNRPLQAELGGNNAALVWGEVDWSEVADKVVRGAFGFAGQRCTANRRLVVWKNDLEQALEALKQALDAYPVGDLRDPAVDCGPVISAGHLERIHSTIEIARRAGAKSFTKPLERAEGYHQSPTVFWQADPMSHLVQVESFGPLLVVQKAQSLQHAMALMNGVSQGLVLSLFSPDQTVRRQFLEGAKAGILKLDQATHGAQPDVPFGGWKQTGVGPPEHGPGDVEFYTRYQALY